MDIFFMLTDCTLAEMVSVSTALKSVVLKSKARFYTRAQKNGNWTLMATEKPEDYGLDPAKGFVSWPTRLKPSGHYFGERNNEGFTGEAYDERGISE